MKRATARSQSGIALMLVMWILALLTVMAVSLTLTQRTETALTSNYVDGARFRAHVDAALAYTAWRFAQANRTQTAAPEDQTTEAQWLPNAVPHSWRFDGADLVISVTNEASRIGLNQADSGLLGALLRALGVSEESVDPLADAIVDWRDEDDLKLLNGAEADEYRHAGRTFGPKNAPFDAVEELRQVLGMTADIYRRLAPEVTVEPEVGTPDETFASAAVLSAVEGISLDEARQRVADRDLPDADTTRAQSIMLGGPLYRVRVTASDAAGAARRAEALIEVAPGSPSGYRLRWRRYGVGQLPAQPADPDHD